MSGDDTQRRRDESVYGREGVVPDRLLRNLGEARVLTDQQVEENTASSHVGKLTPAELLIVKHLSHGLNARMVAEVEGKSTETVRDQIKSARAAMNAKNSVHLVAISLRQGLID